MTSLQITYFLKVANCMSFSKAAEELYVSQPSVSRQVRLLEEELGYELFDRSRKNLISLTAAGMVFRDAFRRSEQGFEAACQAAHELSHKNELRLRVGIGEQWDMSHMLMKFEEEVAVKYPQAMVRFESLPFRPLHERLLAGSLDVVLCTRTSMKVFESLEITPIAELEGRAFVRKGVFCPADEELTIQHFDGKKLLVLPEDEAPMSAQILQLQFQAMQVKPVVEYTGNRSSIYQSLLLGHGFAVYDPYISFAADERLTYFRLEERIPICTVWRKNNQNPLIRLFAEIAAREL